MFLLLGGIAVLYIDVSDDYMCTDIFEYNQKSVLNTSMVGKTVAGSMLIVYYRMYFFFRVVLLGALVGVFTGSIVKLLVAEKYRSLVLCIGTFVGGILTIVLNDVVSFK